MDEALHLVASYAYSWLKANTFTKMKMELKRYIDTHDIKVKAEYIPQLLDEFDKLKRTRFINRLDKWTYVVQEMVQTLIENQSGEPRATILDRYLKKRDDYQDWDEWKRKDLLGRIKTNIKSLTDELTNLHKYSLMLKDGGSKTNYGDLAPFIS